ncbi:hypothetical protein EYF80_061163 [Liparis tanakae]|uniref:Uncharacterized protein n=1 Tax=Liparis tanakae TaxID=230148 RepID=A0A4Z2EJD3_9TELE|nr:hypothetical protein EYF80_061163 [Liparis tanakae]
MISWGGDRQVNNHNNNNNNNNNHNNDHNNNNHNNGGVTLRLVDMDFWYRRKETSPPTPSRPDDTRARAWTSMSTLMPRVTSCSNNNNNNNNRNHSCIIGAPRTEDLKSK